MCDYARATREPYLNIHFCGTESATEWNGYMDGAIQSGERAANEILFAMLGNFSKCNIDYEKTFYFQKKQIEDMMKKNNQRRFKLSLTLVSKYIIYIVLILFSFYFILNYFQI
jgi:hypothetical protein